MTRLLQTAAALAALAASPALHAKSIGEDAVTSGKVALDPTSGYILVSGAARQAGVYLRVPDAETRQHYEEDRLKAFAKAQRKYPGQLESWKANAELAKQTKETPAEPPEEPKLATFSIDPIELRDVESFGPMFAYAKGEWLSYLNSVKPGSFIYYGPVMMAAGSASGGTCYCMGSVRFEVKPGVVTDLGTSLADTPHWEDDADVARMLLREANAKRVAAGKEPIKGLHSDEAKYGLPPSLAAWPSAKPEYRATAKMNNYYGVAVSRMAPVPGVLAYRRDTVVDVRTGTELANPTLVSRAKAKR